MANKIDNIPELLRLRVNEIRGSGSIGALSALTFPQYDDAARIQMFNSHIVHRVVLNKTEFPKVFTNFENMVGDHNSYNQRADADYKVLHVIQKFPNVESAKDCQCVVYIVKNLNTGEYTILERNDVESLAEKYGFQYDNSGIDRFGVGDIIKKGETLSRPTSYDEYGNYGFGRNIKFMYDINQDTTEDAIVISESLANEMGLLESTEVEEVKVPLNDNDFLGNIYGDNETYKCFPDVGESTKNKILCDKKRIVKSQILFDLKASNCKTILNDDTPYYIDGQVVDINIYFNKPYEELNTALFNKQLNDYINYINLFYSRIKEITDELIESGAKCSEDLLYWNKRVNEFINPSIKFKDDMGNTFGNIVMYFTIKRKVGVTVGQKLTGRHGNKGVVSKVLPDYMMPHLETGEVVHIIFNTLGVYNRLNFFQLYEQSINFITERTVHEFIDKDMSVKDMERILFRILEIFNDEERSKIYAAYQRDCITKAKKEEFFNDIKKYGIFIHIPPYWNTYNLYDCIKQCYEEFEWLKPYKVYFWEPHSKRWVAKMNKQIVGSMYVMKLKQSSKKNMSVCSTAPINMLGLPSKNDNAKKHKSLYPKTPIKSGIQETLNNIISINPATSARLHMYYRSSPVARRQLGVDLINNYGMNIPVEPTDTSKMTNRNAEILDAYLKCMGLGLEYVEDVMYLPVDEEGKDDTTVYYHKYNGNKYLGTPKFMMNEVARNIVKNRMDENEIGYIYIGSEGEYKEKVIDELADAIIADMIDLGPEKFFETEGNNNF